MKQKRFGLLGMFFILVALLLVSSQVFSAVRYMNPQPLTDIISTSVRDCSVTSLKRVPTIAWGADIATSLANGNAVQTASGSIFADKGLSLVLYRQDDFARQVEDYLSCKTPLLRGTNGMINMAAEVLNRDPRTRPVYVYKLSDSAGGDALVVKSGIKTPADLKGKTIALQAYGPHVDYMMRILKDAKLTANDVTIKWVKDLIQVDERSSSPAMALLEDGSVDAVFVILPDALALTSGGNVGTGSAGSVKGAQILLSTKSLDTVIADVYVVRKDFFDANREQVQAFTHGLLKAEEQLAKMMKSQGGNQQNVLSAAAGLLLDDTNAVKDVSDMYLDARLSGYRGNVKFFGDPNNVRNFEKLVSESQSALQQLGLLSKVVPMAHARWDYAVLAAGLANTANVEVPKFDAAAVAKVIERRAQQRSTEGELFSFEIYFGPNQKVFSADQYQSAFERVVDLASTYGGALLVVEGHSDPLGYLKQKKKGASPMVLSKARQSARNLSMGRGNAVKDSIITYASGKGISMDASQFGVTGLGFSQPNTPNCTRDGGGDIALSCAPATESEWNATRRVVFKIIQVEAEADVFSPL